MSITVTDPTLITQLLQTVEMVELKTPDGRVLGVFAADMLGRLPPGVTSPFTNEQRAEMRKQRDGRPLADVLRDLENRS